MEVLDDRLGELATDRQHRRERGHRFLEDHRQLFTPDGLELAVAYRQKIPTVVKGGAGDNPSRGVRDQSHDGKGGDALDRKSTRLNSSHYCASRMTSSA